MAPTLPREEPIPRENSDFLIRSNPSRSQRFCKLAGKDYNHPGVVLYKGSEELVGNLVEFDVQVAKVKASTLIDLAQFNNCV